MEELESEPAGGVGDLEPCIANESDNGARGSCQRLGIESICIKSHQTTKGDLLSRL